MSNLDDFFAKKDKKKKKGFSKANAEVIAKNLEENDRKEMKADEKMATSEATRLALSEDADRRAGGAEHQLDPASKGGTVSTSSAVGETAYSYFSVPVKTVEDMLEDKRTSRERAYFGTMSKEEMNDDDWLDYDNHKRDLSNLKIDALKVNEKDVGGDDEDGEHEINEEGERVRKSDGGPWNKIGKENKNDDEDSDSEKSPGSPVTSKKSTSTSSAANATSKGSYVPPHLRGGNATNASGPTLNPVRLGVGGAGGRRNRMAPDINSEVNFPSLSASSVPTGDEDRDNGSKEEFEEVRSGGHQMSSRNTEGPKLALDNKFAALRE